MGGLVNSLINIWVMGQCVLFELINFFASS
jgi:hypothetical protein